MTLAKSESFPREHRLRTGPDFQRVYARRQTASDQVLLVFGLKNGLLHSRLGLSVSKKVGPAVTRNRWKRMIREAFRRQRELLPQGFDFIAIPRANQPASQEDVRTSLLQLSNRIASRPEQPRRAAKVIED